jgi:hypothetical protein
MSAQVFFHDRLVSHKLQAEAAKAFSAALRRAIARQEEEALSGSGTLMADGDPNLRSEGTCEQGAPPSGFGSKDSYDRDSRTVDTAFEILRNAGWTFTEAREVLLVPTNAVVGITSQPSCCTKEQG